VQIFSITPAFVSLGQTNALFEISGTGFVQVTSVDLGGGIKILSMEVPTSELIHLEANVSKSAEPGHRKITVTTAGGTAVLENAFTVRNNLAPTVRFTYSPQTGSIYSIYEFDGSATTDDRQVVKLHWEFGDGSAANGVEVMHQFREAGEYIVRLTATDNQEGSSSAEKEVRVVENLSPVASFSVSPLTGTPSTDFLFNGSSSVDPDGELKTYQWDFEDGTAKGVTVHHKFSRTGSFRVVLTVKDNANEESVAQRTVIVEKEPEFDRDRAIREINDVVVEFLELFGQLEQLSANQIVVGFSTSSGCRGREHEINIIENQQQKVQEVRVDVYAPADVPSVSETRGRAILAARFSGTNNDGTTFDGVTTHDFSMIFDPGGWKICNFTIY
jgi:PKD repeat protein